MHVATWGSRRGVHERRDAAEASETRSSRRMARAIRLPVSRTWRFSRSGTARRSDGDSASPSPCIGDETHAAGIVHARLSRTSLDK